MRITVYLTVLFVLGSGCNSQQLQNILGTLSEPTTAEMGSGLKEALTKGITAGANQLAATNGYYQSPFKILLPPEVRNITDRLQVIPGYSRFEEIILEKINRGAEDAAKKAVPIFTDAIRAMTIRDALDILMGPNDAATTYLNRQTYHTLYKEFNPVIVSSLNKFNAIEYYEEAVTKYNSLPLVKKVNPRLDDYVTNEALAGLFRKVAEEELKIRTNISARNTALLKKVFAKQDSNRATFD